jgi:hypothetical protein
VVTVSFLVAPKVFGGLPRTQAGDLMAGVFGGYYWLGITLGVMALAAGITLARHTGWTWERWAAVVLLIGMVGSAGYTRLIVMPDLMEARTAMQRASSENAAPYRARLDALHHLSVVLNAGVLLGGMGVMLLEAAREHRRERARAT